MSIAILDDYQHVIQGLECFNMLDEQEEVLILHTAEKDPARLAAALDGVEVLVLTRERTDINEALLSRLPHLRLISQTGKISRHIDLDACNKYGVAVAEGVGSPIAPAELTWALIMNVLRQIPAAIEGMKHGKWQVNMGQSVHGKTIGIWGYGKIGKMVANYAKVFGARVLVWGSEASRGKALEDGFDEAASKAAFFSQADVISLHLRLNESTTGIVQEIDLDMMKPTAVLINTARAELIAPDALLNALKKGRPGFAGIDVYEEEPVYNPHDELLKMPNVVCTPHIGYVEKNGYELYFGAAFENVINFLEGAPTHIVNPQVLR